MLSNFRKMFGESYFSRSQQEQQLPLLSPSESRAGTPDTDHPERTRTNDPNSQQQWANAMSETVYVPGCTCAFCAMRSQINDVAEPICNAPWAHSRSHDHRSLPSFRSVMEVLYPPSYLGASSPFPEPPSYSRSDSLAHPAREDDPDTCPLISSMTSSIEGRPPLEQDPSLTGVPSQRIPSGRVLLVEPNPPTIDLDDVLEEPLPAYSRFDQRRPRFPAASDMLGPYPPMSVLCQSAR